MTKGEVNEAYHVIYGIIRIANVSNAYEDAAKKAASLLRDTALKAIPEPGAMTATQLDDRARQAEIIAHGDGLQLFGSLIPYLLRRQEAARHYMDRPSDEGLEYLTAINKTIAELLNIF